MKKILVILTAAILAVFCAVSIHAADTAVISMSGAEAKVGAGTVTVTVSTDRPVLAKALYIGDFDYDTGLIEMVSGKWLTTGAVISDFNVSAGDGVAAFDSNQTISGDLLELRFRVLADYPTSVPVGYSLNIRVKSDDGEEFQLPGVKCSTGWISVTEDPVYLGMEQKTVNASEGTVSVDVKIPAETAVKSMLIRPRSDLPGLELIGGEWLIDGDVQSGWSRTNADAVITFSSNKKVSGPIFRITYRILDSAEGEIEFGLENLVVKKYSSVLKEEYKRMTDLGFGKITVVRAIRGDVNDDGRQDSDDAIYLLRHTMNPARYPINQSGDMNGDGRQDSDDAIYLLRHTMNPTRYPLF